MPASMLAVGSLASGGAALAGLFGGGSGDASNVQMPPMWQMPNMTGAANNVYDTISGLGNYNTAAGALPQYQTQVSNIVNSPYASGAVSGAQGVTNLAGGAGADLLGAGHSYMPYAYSVLNQGFDPMQALYGRTLQQLTDQTRAGLEARGVDSSPYGAGIEGDVMKNFNIDWQNNLLGREQTAANTAGGIFNQAGQLETQGLGAIANSYMLPYQTYNQIGSNNLGALGVLSNAGVTASSIPQTQAGDWLSYLGAGTSQQGANNQTASVGLNQANMVFSQGQTLGNNLGQSLAGLGRAYGMMFPGNTGQPTGAWGANTGAPGGGYYGTNGQVQVGPGYYPQ